ncbi:uncharacterized protein LOC144110604 [Amblyomma americanum]
MQAHNTQVAKDIGDAVVLALWTSHQTNRGTRALLLTGFYYQPPVSSRCLPDPQAAAADWILDPCNHCTDYLCTPQPFLEASNLMTWQHATISADQDTYIRGTVFTVQLGHGTAGEMPGHSPFMLFQVNYYYSCYRDDDVCLLAVSWPPPKS